MKYSESEFNRLFKENQSSLKSFIYRLVTNTEDVEDICQEAFIKAYKNIESFNGKSTFKTWLFAITSNLIKDHFKAQKRWTRYAQDNCSQSIKNSIESQDETMRLYALGKFEIRNHIDYCFTCVMKYLPIERQIAIMLADIYEFKIVEIAQILNKTIGSVKHLLYNGRNTMKQVFNEDCILIHKTGACWKCSELSNSGNTKADTQQKIAKLEMVKAKNKGVDNAKLYTLRTQLVKAINPLESSSHELHDFLLNQTDFANNKSYSRIDKDCGE